MHSIFVSEMYVMLEDKTVPNLQARKGDGMKLDPMILTLVPP